MRFHNALDGTRTNWNLFAQFNPAQFKRKSSLGGILYTFYIKMFLEIESFWKESL